MKHVIVATVEQQPHTLNRILSLFRMRGFAIESMTWGHTEIPGIMRLTLVVDGSKTMIEQVTKQLYKVIEVRKVSDITEDRTVTRELALIKVTAKAQNRAEIMQIADIYQAKIVDVTLTSLMIEVTGPTEKIDSFVALVRGFGIKEMVRTGVVAMVRGSNVLTERALSAEERSVPENGRGRKPTQAELADAAMAAAGIHGGSGG